MGNNKLGLWVLIALVVGLVGGYYVKKVQDEAAKKAADDAAKAANPFQAVNPLEGVEANPFEKAKSILNPFK